MTKFLLELIRLLGLLSRATTESNSTDYLSTIYAIRKVCDIAIQQLTFRVVDIEQDVDDDEL